MQGTIFQVKPGDRDIMPDMGGLFLQHSPDKVKAILEAAEKRDAKALQLAAHSLKSSSAYIGAMRLSGLAKELEMAAAPAPWIEPKRTRRSCESWPPSCKQR